MSDLMFIRHSQRVISVGRQFPSGLVITRELIEYAPPGLLRREGRTLSFRLVNAAATYRIERKHPTLHHTYICRRTG